MMQRSWSRCGSVAVLAVGMLLSSGCANWRGLNSLPMPGTQGRGAGSFLIQVQMPDVSNLEPNSRVRVADVSVGTVTRSSGRTGMRC
jgi:phospholipid/cholesterol/gamma-HCH transport system substrate-binding protein